MNTEHKSHVGYAIDGAESLVNATAKRGEENIVSVQDSLQRDLDAARTRLEQIEATLAARAHSVNEFVHKRPWQALGYAAGVSAVFGLLMGAFAFRRWI